MSDLRRAAADLLESVEAALKAGDWKVDGACDPTLDIERLRQALADAQMARVWEQKQEPVAWMHTSATGHVYFRKKPHDKVYKPQPVYTAPPSYPKNLNNWMGLTEAPRKEHMADQELETLAKQAGFSVVRVVWKSHKIHVDTLQPANYQELRRFYEIAFEQGKQEEGKNRELSKL